MATKKTEAKPTKKAKVAEELDLWDYGSMAMLRYGTEVNEDRAIVAIQDGLKPVARRLLWAARTTAQKQGKSARLVGQTMGEFHPHGDASIYGALTTMVNSPMPPCVGIGNWGSMIANAAAMRYTEVKLSTYGKQFLVTDYVAVTPMTPNYDDKTMEPVYLPSLLPNIFINDSLGIGYSVTAGWPSFTPESVLQVMLRMLNKERMDPSEFAKALVLYEPWGGVPVKSKANRRAIQDLMESDTASVLWHSPLKIEKDAKRITVEQFPPQLNHDKFIAACRQIPQVKKTASGDGLSYIIQVHPGTNMNEFDAVCLKVQKLTEKSIKYKLYVSDRQEDPESKTNEPKITFHSGSIPQIMLRWLKHRIALEAKCLEYRIEQTEKVIARLKLLIHACKHLDIIINALKTDDPDKVIAKGLKITMEEAAYILSLRVRQLSKLDLAATKKKLEAMEQRKSKLQKQLERPAQNVKRYFQSCLDLLTQRAREERSSSKCIHWWLKSNPVNDDTQQLLAAGTGQSEEGEGNEQDQD